MKNVIGVSLGSSSQDFEFTTRFLGERMTVRRLGTDGSIARAERMLRRWETRADAIGIGVVKDRYTVGSQRFTDRDSARLTSVVQSVPVTTGGRLGDIFLEWAVRHV